MELTPEEMRRIEDEERKRLAEERYRADVRAKLQNPSTTGPGLPSPAAQPQQPTKKSSGLKWSVGILAVVGIVAVIFANTNNQPSTNNTLTSTNTKIRYVPVNQKIASGQIIVKAGGYVYYRINIVPDMREATVTGSFNASGGSGNDISAVIASERDYANWINGHQAKVYWGTQGRATTGNFDLHLGPGVYYLAISNKFSTFSDKSVFLEVDLNYKRLETFQ